ncbi:OpgC protein [Gimesia chilikensis]|uniref:OpgC protein n=1 Tax=Gimesia chilikensis TaxID=2605989 RepID=A0A517WJH5_9PLAN|nr:OpgC domain-containing protein [Gimesia chilikensis]QDU05409.1 OpgC protein [Gimesia chilikensis]
MSRSRLFTQIPPISLTNKITRDLRIDFFRGLALLMILVDHVESRLELEMLSHFTLKSVGYCDAAEVFVFLSGYLYGRVYDRIYEEQGTLKCLSKSVQRGISLYFITLLTLICCLAISIPFALFNPPISARLHLTPFISQPIETMLYASTLLFEPYGFGILRLYIIFFVALIPLLFLLFQSNKLLAWLLSINLYLCSQLFSEFTVPMLLEEIRLFHFNPFAWQFLFFIGISIGSKPDFAKSVLNRFRFLGYISLIISGAVVFLNVVQPLLSSLVAAESIVEDPFDHSFLSKQMLAPERLINFLALAYLVNMLTSIDDPFWKSRMAYPFVVCGKNPLTIYCLGLVLMYLIVAISFSFSLSVWWVTMLNIAGCLLSCLVAQALNRHRQIDEPGKPIPDIRAKSN